jgi:hypothetical protein
VLVSPRIASLWTDGERYVAYDPRGPSPQYAPLGRIEILDTWTGRRRHVAVEADCRLLGADMPGGREGEWFARRGILVECAHEIAMGLSPRPESPRRYALIHAWTGAVTTVSTGFETPVGSRDAVLSVLGDQWIRGEVVCGTPALCRAFVNWRTGEKRLLPYAAPDSRDLDDPNLKPLGPCRPFGTLRPDLPRGKYEAPYATVAWPRGPGGGADHRLLLSRCGGRRTTLAPYMHLGARSWLSSGSVSWFSFGGSPQDTAPEAFDDLGVEFVVRAYDIDTGRRRRWSYRNVGGLVGIAHTRRSVMVLSQVYSNYRPQPPEPVFNISELWAVQIRR